MKHEEENKTRRVRFKMPALDKSQQCKHQRASFTTPQVHFISSHHHIPPRLQQRFSSLFNQAAFNVPTAETKAINESSSNIEGCCVCVAQKIFLRRNQYFLTRGRQKSSACRLPSHHVQSTVYQAITSTVKSSRS